MSRALAGLCLLSFAVPNSYAGEAMSDLRDLVLGGTKFGNASFHSYLGVTESYDSNIYLVPDDKAYQPVQGGGVRGAWVTKSNAGLGFDLPMTPMHSLDGNAAFTMSNYSKQARINDYNDMSATLGYKYKGPIGLSARLYDTYINTADAAFSELAGTRSQRWANTIGAGVSYALPGGPLRASLFGTHTANKYVDGVTFGPSLNRYEQTFGTTAGYMVQPKTQVFVGYRRQAIHYTSNQTVGTNKNNKSHFIDVGVEGRFAPKLTGRFTTGAQLKDYDQAFNAVGVPARHSYALSWIFAGNMTWQPQGNCTWNLDMSRSLQESTFATNRYYTSNNLNLKVDHTFPGKLSGHVRLALAIDSYPERSTTGLSPQAFAANRRDDTYTQGVGVGYALASWVSLGLDYEHGQRFSIFSGQYNYERHLTSANLRLTY